MPPKRLHSKTPAFVDDNNTPQPELTAKKQEALDAIKHSWKIDSIADMFIDPEHKRNLEQHPSPNHNFFEEATLVLFRRLAELTEDTKEPTQKKFKSRRRLRAKSERDKDGIKRRAGDGAVKKNRNLRNDLRLFIREINKEEVFDIDWENETGDDEAEEIQKSKEASAGFKPTLSVQRSGSPTPDGAEKHSETKETEQVEQSEHEHPLVSPSISNKEDGHFGKKRLAVEGMKVHWDIDSPTEIVPKTYYQSRLAENPQSWDSSVLSALYQLSKVSKGRTDDVKRRLQERSEDINGWGPAGIVGVIREVEASFTGDLADEAAVLSDGALGAQNPDAHNANSASGTSSEKRRSSDSPTSLTPRKRQRGLIHSYRLPAKFSAKQQQELSMLHSRLERSDHALRIAELELEGARDSRSAQITAGTQVPGRLSEVQRMVVEAALRVKNAWIDIHQLQAKIGDCVGWQNYVVLGNEEVLRGQEET